VAKKTVRVTMEFTTDEEEGLPSLEHKLGLLLNNALVVSLASKIRRVMVRKNRMKTVDYQRLLSSYGEDERIGKEMVKSLKVEVV